MLYETEEKQECYVLLGVDTGKDGINEEKSLDELRDLLETDGGAEAGRIIQKLSQPDPLTYLGTGKLEEVKALLAETGADGVITDDELSPSQLRKLSQELDTLVLDRTRLILDIFASRAVTKEGKLQVELANLQYRLTRLRGFGVEMSRQASAGTAVGGHTRGSGETKLEMDRRYLRDRIDQLRREIKEIASRRETERVSRKEGELPLVALVGYTNAGKSTLFNRLTHSGVLEENKLFATLDTTVRRRDLPSGRSVLFVDTVGFIHKLPHNLVDAFRATLEEACEADVLLMVVDASDSECEMHMRVTYEELVSLGAADKPIIVALNKQDLVTGEEALMIPFNAHSVIRISAISEEGVQTAMEAVDSLLDEADTLMEVLIPYQRGDLVSTIHQELPILEESFEAEGTKLKVRAKGKLREILKPFAIS